MFGDQETLLNVWNKVFFQGIFFVLNVFLGTFGSYDTR